MQPFAHKDAIMEESVLNQKSVHVLKGGQASVAVNVSYIKGPVF